MHQRPSRRFYSQTLFEQVRFARLWLPIAIIGVVLGFQLSIVPRLASPWETWVPVLFYSILGPLATFATLNWIAEEVMLKERAQAELADLYEELRESHEMLGAIHDVTARYAAAPDLEAVMSVAADGVMEVTAAAAACVVVGSAELGAVHGVGLTPELESDARARQATVVPPGAEATQDAAKVVTADGTELFVLSLPLSWSGRTEGALHAYYAARPDQRTREALGILASQLSAAAESARSRLRDLLTLMEVDRTVRAEGNLERMLVTVLKEMTKRLAAPMGGVFLADDDGVLRLSASVGMPIGATPITYRLGEGLVGRVGATGEAALVGELGDDSRNGSGPLLSRARSAIVLPLLTDTRLLGVTLFAHPEPHAFDGASLPYLGLLASQVSLALRNAAAYLQSEELAITEERTRIAREIHDGVAQLLAFTALKLDLVGRLVDRDTGKAKAELELARDTVRETIKEIRRSIFALRPVDLERYGYLETVERYVSDFGQQNELQVRLHVNGAAALSPKAEVVLFRIFQEAMHNVAKHAKASSVTVTSGVDELGMAYVSVQDDGAGFDVEQVGDRVTSAGGLGLRQMRERVERIGGRLTIASAPGRGTTVTAAVPAQEAPVVAG